MPSCILGVSYTMLADVWKETVTIDPDTNESDRQWAKFAEIRCLVVPYLDGGIRGAGSTERFIAGKYNPTDYARLKSATVLNKRHRVTNVRDAKTGIVLWADEESDGSPTMFNVDGSAPVVNPVTGRVFEYVSTLSRTEVKR